MNTPDQPRPEPPEAPSKGVCATSRRRFLKGGLAAGPVVATFASRPVLGATVECTTASGHTSFVPVGSAHRNVHICSGQTSAQWASTSQWPGGYVAGATNTTSSGTATLTKATSLTPQPTKFHSGATGFGGTIMGNRTLRQVLQLGDGGAYGVAKYCATALLNAAAGRTPVLTETRVRNIWNEYINRGYFEPTAGVRWDSTQIVTYIKSTIA